MSHVFITRHIKNKKYVYYIGTNQIIDSLTLLRISKLHIPPAWTNIKISTSDTDYLQVTGEDDKNRVQYLYHPMWMEITKIEKYSRLKSFIKKLPKLITIVNSNLSKSIHFNDKDYIISLIFRILLRTYSRVGNEIYAEENNTYGLTTLLKKHISISGDTVTLSFVGKKNVKQNLEFTDKLSVKILKELLKLKGDRIFKTDDGIDIKSCDINKFMKTILGEEYSVKDFRTFSSNDLFLKRLYSKEIPLNITSAKKNINECYDEVAEKLGHTREVSRSSYVIPSISEKYLEDPVKFMKARLNLQEII